MHREVPEGERALAAAPAELAIARRLLGTHVTGRPDGAPDLGDVVATRLEDGARDPEVGEHRVPVDEEHVFWLDVPVNEPLAMRVVESRAQLARDAQGILEREPLLAHEALAQ